ncbi:hypothetical protein FAD_0835 [Ferroplasma acidiphilum]|uniref:Uncharacterized protein n=2 Tax=Ferroplasma acidiphilum TaxID=74969 RepID=A0A1V0N3S3_9ARCH|nr:hypothetical protein FAD_0835 [Ferroplasma acidiphilum]
MMKELTLYKIRDMALKNNVSVYNVNEFANLIQKNNKVAIVYMNRLVRNNLATKPVNGKISFINDDFIMASQLIYPSYISTNSALLFHKLAQQVPGKVECVTTINSINYNKLGISYHKIKPELFFGYKRYNYNNSYIFVANPDKAVFDGLYLNIFSENDINEFKNNIDFSDLIRNLKNIKIRKIKKIMEILK